MGVFTLLLIFGGVISASNCCDRSLNCDECVIKQCQYVLTKAYETFCLVDYKAMNNLKMKVENKKGCGMIQRVQAKNLNKTRSTNPMVIERTSTSIPPPPLPAVPTTTPQSPHISSSSITSEPHENIPSPQPTLKNSYATPTTPKDNLGNVSQIQQSSLEEDNSTSSTTTSKPYHTYDLHRGVWVQSIFPSHTSTSAPQTEGGARKHKDLPEMRENHTSMEMSSSFNSRMLSNPTTHLPLTSSNEATTTESLRINRLDNGTLLVNNPLHQQTTHLHIASHYNTAIPETTNNDNVTHKFAKQIHFSPPTVQQQQPYIQPGNTHFTAPHSNTLGRRPHAVNQEPYSKFPLSDVRDVFMQIPLSYKCNSSNSIEAALLTFGSAMCNTASISNRFNHQVLGRYETAWLNMNPAYNYNGTCKWIRKVHKKCRGKSTNKNFFLNYMVNCPKSLLFAQINTTFRCNKNVTREPLTDRLGRSICFLREKFMTLNTLTKMNSFDFGWSIGNFAFKYPYHCKALKIRKVQCFPTKSHLGYD